MTKRLTACIAALLAWAVIELGASGQAGIYGIVEKVVLEPAGRAPERVQVWGVFALIERMPGPVSGAGGTEVGGQYFTNYLYQKPARGYLYFRLPDAAAAIDEARAEWTDLAAVSGTKQAIAFGYWDRFRGDALMRVRDAAARPENPDQYYIDVGIAKLGATGNHAAIVAELLKLLPPEKGRGRP
jgi:hypothetical protein